MTLPASIPADLRALIMKCWHQDPKKRPKMAVILKALVQSLTDLDKPIRPDTLPVSGDRSLTGGDSLLGGGGGGVVTSGVVENTAASDDAYVIPALGKLAELELESCKNEPVTLESPDSPPPASAWLGEEALGEEELHAYYESIVEDRTDIKNMYVEIEVVTKEVSDAFSTLSIA